MDRGYNDVLAEVRRHDRINSTRKVAPLKPAVDAIILDSTTLSIEAVVSTILEMAEVPGSRFVRRCTEVIGQSLR